MRLISVSLLFVLASVSLALPVRHFTPGIETAPMPVMTEAHRQWVPGIAEMANHPHCVWHVHGPTGEFTIQDHGEDDNEFCGCGCWGCGRYEMRIGDDTFRYYEYPDAYHYSMYVMGILTELPE